jgi:hypothetical protein
MLALQTRLSVISNTLKPTISSKKINKNDFINQNYQLDTINLIPQTVDRNKKFQLKYLLNIHRFKMQIPVIMKAASGGVKIQADCLRLPAFHSSV